MFSRSAFSFLLMTIGVFTITNGWCASHHPQAFLEKIAGSADEGIQIVNHYCANCHAEQPMIQLGAPRIGQEADWKPRIKQGIDALFKHTDEGLNAMPSRGGCFECNDKQLMMAVMAMLPQASKNELFSNRKTIK